MPRNDPHSFAVSDQGKIEHIDFDLRLDFPSRSIRGVAQYRMDRVVDGSLFLDSRQLKIERILGNGVEIAWELDQDDPILGQRLHLKNLDALSAFSIEFLTDPGASALQWLEPNQTAGGVYPFLFSQCQPIHARSIFPCQDTPSIRFTFTAEMWVAEPMIGLMAAASVATNLEAGFNRCRFEMPQPIPSYLFALAAGNIDSRDIGPRCRIFAEPEVIESAAWEFADTEDKLIQAEKLFSPYEWDRYDMLLMPPSFPYGGMENPRLSFLTPTAIVGDRSLTLIVTHELAHSWTGNLVTNATWEDFWLNEGWTVYAERRIEEVLEGSDSAQLSTAIGRQSMFESMQRFGMDSDPTRLKYSMKDIDPDETFSTIPYYKGFEFLTALEREVGREAFDQFLKKYIASFRFKSLTTEDFVAYLEHELPEALTQVNIQEWLYEPGFPENVPSIKSRLMDEVTVSLDSYQNGGFPTKDDVAGWNSDQVNLFLRRLPDQIPVQDCKFFEDLFELQDSNNYSILYIFLSLAIRSGYKDVLPRVEKLISTIGRGLFLNRVFRAMVQTEWSRKYARSLFEQYRHRHHPLIVSSFERILAEAGM